MEGIVTQALEYGLFAGLAVFMLWYFMKQLAAKDERNAKNTERFIEIAQKNTEAFNGVQEALNQLKNEINRNHT